MSPAWPSWWVRKLQRSWKQYHEMGTSLGLPWSKAHNRLNWIEASAWNGKQVSLDIRLLMNELWPVLAARLCPRLKISTVMMVQDKCVYTYVCIVLFRLFVCLYFTPPFSSFKCSIFFRSVVSCGKERLISCFLYIILNRRKPQVLFTFFRLMSNRVAEKQLGNYAQSTEHYRQQPKQMTRKFHNWVFGINMPAGKSENEYSECVPPGALSTSQENLYSTLNFGRNEFLNVSALTVSTKNLWEGKTTQQSTRDLRLEPMYIDVVSESTTAGKSSRRLTCLIAWLVMLTILSFASLAVTVFIFYKGGMTNEKLTSTTLDTNGRF